MPTEEQLDKQWESSIEFGSSNRTPSFLTQKDEPTNNIDMQQLTNEEIARVYMMYNGAQMQYEQETYPFETVTEVIGIHTDFHACATDNRCNILLKPLSEISDEDAWVYYDLDAAFPETVNTNQGRLNIVREWISLGKSMGSDTYQFLISRSYDVPLFFAPNHWANGKTPIELNIAINNK